MLDNFPWAIPALLVVLFLLSRRTRGRPVEQVHFRGRCLREEQEVRALLDSMPRGDLPLSVAGFDFPASIAPRHFAFVGTTGSGKTVLQRLLMQSAFATFGKGSKKRALVYDAKSDVLSLLAGMKMVVPIYPLNPLDSRSLAWHMAADVSSPATALQVATLLSPPSKNDSNPFFSNASRHLVYGALLFLIKSAPERWTFRHLLLLLRDGERLATALHRFEDTRHLLGYFRHPSTAQNVLASVLSLISPFEIIAACWDRAQSAISLKDWFHESSILVLGNDDQNRAALDAINQLLFQRLSELALGRSEAPEGERTWFFLDEVREAGRLDLLGRLLTKGRSKGVSVVLGFQDIAGMREVYGPNVADELLGQCNTKVILRLNGHETAEWAAKLFGAREVIQLQVSHSKSWRGLKADTKGNAVSHTITSQSVVLDSELLGLPEASPEAGLSAFVINPITGPFRTVLSGSKISSTLAPRAQLSDFIPRLPDEQLLRPWDGLDDALFGLSLPGEN